MNPTIGTIVAGENCRDGTWMFTVRTTSNNGITLGEQVLTVKDGKVIDDLKELHTYLSKEWPIFSPKPETIRKGIDALRFLLSY
jgi:hypothetical protein